MRIMFYNYIKSILFTVITIITLNSCTSEADDIFELSALERANQHQQQCFDALVGAEKGWIVNYFPEADKFGGYTFVMKFSENGRVVITPEEGFEENASESTFRVHSGQSTVLAFDTYGALHHLADPEELKPEYKNTEITWEELSESPYVNYGRGYEGDFEFTCDTIAENYIAFKSLKRKTDVIFTKITDTDGGAYLAAQAEMAKIVEEKATEGLFLSYQGSEYELTYDFFHKFNIYKRDQYGFYMPEAMPFVVTDKGIKLYKAEEINNVFAIEFIWDAENEVFASVENVELVYGHTDRADFTNPASYQIYWVNMELSSQAFKNDIKVLEGEMRSALAIPGDFGGVQDIRFIMNGYPTAQAYVGGSHRIDLYSEVKGRRESNFYLIGTQAVSMTEASFNFAIDFGDGQGGKAGYAAFHGIVNDWLYNVLYKPNVYSIELEERWSYGEKYTNTKLIRNNDSNYFLILEKQEF